MILKIAGGCGEHGRNCFYVEAKNVTFLVDCGVMAAKKAVVIHTLHQKKLAKLIIYF